MDEIIRKLIKLNELDEHISNGEEYVITEVNSISDVLRFLVDLLDGDKDELHFLLDDMEKTDG